MDTLHDYYSDESRRVETEDVYSDEKTFGHYLFVALEDALRQCEEGKSPLFIGGGIVWPGVQNPWEIHIQRVLQAFKALDVDTLHMYACGYEQPSFPYRNLIENYLKALRKVSESRKKGDGLSKARRDFRSFAVAVAGMEAEQAKEDLRKEVLVA